MSPAAAQLVRRVARTMLTQPDELVAELDAAVLGAAEDALRGEPTLVAEVSASTRANLEHWASSSERDPAARVPVNLSRAVLGIAREAFRRGVEQTVPATYHAGQNVVWAHWMRSAFAICSDPAVLAEALEAAARSLADFVDDTISALAHHLEQERVELTRDSQHQRFEVVSLVLDGAPITEKRAGARLAYDLHRPHTAAILWMDPADPDQAALSRAADALARAARSVQALTVAATSSSLWAWFTPGGELDTRALAATAAPYPGVRIAVGSTEPGIAGFRRSHADAGATQRLMMVRPGLQATRFTDVQLVILAVHDPQRAAEFVARTLGRLSVADEELRETLRVYVREQFNAARAARTLYAHRNTVLNRLRRAEQLLPAPLAGTSLEVGVALEIAHWLPMLPDQASRESSP